jgi:hypothetical protein
MEEEDCIQQVYYRMCVWWTRIVYNPIYYGSVYMENEDSIVSDGMANIVDVVYVNIVT